MNVALDSPTGCILEVDLEYPQNLHNAHTDFIRRVKPPSKGETNSLPRCMIRSVTSYIIETCSNVLVMIFEFQKFIAY